MDEEVKPCQAPQLEEMSTSDLVQSNVSKTQLKKLRKREEWEAGREERKLKRKEKMKKKRERRRATTDQAAKPPHRPTVSQDQRVLQLPITIVIDCGFDDLMTEREMISLANQLTRCYSDNKHARFRVHLAFASFDGKLKERFDTVLRSNYETWKGVKVFSKNFVHVSQHATEDMSNQPLVSIDSLPPHLKDRQTDDPESQVIYLTSDSPNTLTDLNPQGIYILGGLVDKNRHKGLCYNRAVEHGVKTARLPISQYLRMNTRQVLATNHVNEIMLKWLDLGDWAEAFMSVIPTRKGGTLIEEERRSASEDDNKLENVDEQVSNEDSGSSKEYRGEPSAQESMKVVQSA